MFKAINSQLPQPERWFENNEFSLVTVEREGLNDSLEVPANLDDTLITPQAVDHWPPPAACPQFLTNCSLLKQTFSCFQNISGSVFIHTGRVFLVRKIAGRKKIPWSANQAMNPKPTIPKPKRKIVFCSSSSSFGWALQGGGESGLFSAFQTHFKFVSIIII